ncbi:MAG: squalene/phytoene synthase family protein [Janthinobacterium lividum]
MTELSPLGRIVRRHDPDRFLTALFAPPARRETLFLLYAVNHELARAREVVSNPMLALIRLQWWREVAEGARRRHEVAGPLGEALDDGRLRPADILQMIEGREAETEPVEDVAAFRAYVRAAFGGVAAAAGCALGAEGAALDILRHLGAAYGVAGILRSVPVLARQDRCVLPLDVLRSAGLSEADLGSAAAPAAFVPVQATLAGIGRDWLADGSRTRLPRAIVAAALPGVLARYDLRHPGRDRPRGVAIRVAVAVAAASGRI